MSKYYEIDKPFSIENWNSLVRDVNNILENPPGDGPGCDPIEPLKEVEDPHIWTVEDIEEMREKLLLTCDNLSFSEKLEIWKSKIIDEIEKQMEDAWCDCEVEKPEPVVTSCGGYHQNKVKAGRSEDICCGNVIESAPCGCGNCHRNTYLGDWYPSVYASNKAKTDSMRDSYYDTLNATGVFGRGITKMLNAATNIDKWQGYVDSSASAVDAGITYWNANCGKIPPEVDAPNCPDVADNIQVNGESARYWQNKVDEELVKWAEGYSETIASLSDADSHAASNWSDALSLEGRYPDDVNHISECFDSIVSSGLDWYKWWNPYRGESPSMPKVKVWKENETLWPGGGRASLNYIRITPNGLPYAKSTLGKWYGSERYTLTYYENKFEIRSPLSGCIWSIEHDFEKIWYNDDDFFIWAPLPEPNLDDYGTTIPYIEVTKPAGSTKDWTEKQNEWYAEYQNWYDKHPAYDDRHESY